MMHWLDPYGRQHFENVLLEEGKDGGVFSLIAKCSLFLSVYVDEMKMARQFKKHMPKMWAILRKKTDLEDQVSFID